MPTTSTDAMLDRDNETEDAFERLVNEGSLEDAFLTLIEGGQEGFAFYELTALDHGPVDEGVKHGLIRIVAEGIDVDHAMRLASKWKVSSTLPRDVLDLFRRKSR